MKASNNSCSQVKLRTVFKILTVLLIIFTFYNSHQKVDREVGLFVWVEGHKPQNEYQYNFALSTTEKVFVTGGYKNMGAFEVYHPKSDHWTELPPLPTPRCFTGGAILNNSIYVVGGIDDSNVYASTVEKYDINSNKWTVCKELPTARSRLAAVSYNGKVYVFGGLEGTDDKHSQNTSAVDQYDPITDTWTRKSDLPTPRHGHSALVVEDKILVVGGYTNNDPTGIVEVYDPQTDKWASKSAMPTPRGFFGLVNIDKYVYAIAGRVRQDNGPIEQYDLETDKWEQLDPLPELRNRFGIATISNKVYLIGGENNPKSVLIGELRK